MLEITQKTPTDANYDKPYLGNNDSHIDDNDLKHDFISIRINEPNFSGTIIAPSLSIARSIYKPLEYR